MDHCRRSAPTIWLCGSRVNAVGTTAQAIRSADAGFIIAGGVESMTRAPYVLDKASAPFDRQQMIEDTTIGWRFVNRFDPRSRRLLENGTFPLCALQTFMQAAEARPQLKVREGAKRPAGCSPCVQDSGCRCVRNLGGIRVFRHRRSNRTGAYAQAGPSRRRAYARIPIAREVSAGASRLSITRTGTPKRESSSAAVRPIAPAPTIRMGSVVIAAPGIRWEFERIGIFDADHHINE
jgi:hypothetical protein